MEKIVFQLPIYTYQIDFSRHVSNIVYIEWMEIARLKLLEAAGMAAHEMARSGSVPVLTETRIIYKKPLYLGDVVHIEIWLSELKFASARMEFRFYNGMGELAASGQQKGLFIDLENTRPQRISVGQRSRLLPYLGDESDSISERPAESEPSSPIGAPGGPE